MTGAWQQGAALALQMLNACGNCTLGDVAVDPRARDSKPHKNVVAPFLERLAGLQDRDVREGFAAVLSEVLVSAYEGGVQDLAFLRRDVAQLANSRQRAPRLRSV